MISNTQPLKNRFSISIILATLFALLMSPFLFVSPSNAQEFTQGYSSKTSLLRGTVVAGVSGEDNQVEAVNSERNEDILGIVVRSNDSAVTLTEDTTGVFVATTGRFEVLVSSLNGPISSGDFITTSPINGIGQRTTPTERLIIGKSLVDFDFSDQSKILSQEKVTDSDGNEIVVSIARVLADIVVGPNPDLQSEAQAPEFLVSFSETIAGKPVSAIRIYAGLIIVIIAGAISGSLLYSSVKTSIISIGRNPLSKNSVLTGLAQVVIISVIIFISGLVAVYLLLKI